MIISNFTVIELDYFRDNCNFVGDEKLVFELRSSGILLEEIADIMSVSVDKVKKISRKINKKIIKSL